jgi:PAS domain S-box-containing protein
MKPQRDAGAGQANGRILESIADGIFTVDREWRITAFNRAAERLTGLSRAKALGQRCFDVFRSDMCESNCALRETMASGRPIVGRTGHIVDHGGARIPVSVSTSAIRDDAGRIVGGAETLRDLSAVEAAGDHAAGREQVGDLISRSPAMQRVLAMLPSIAASMSTVLILGETGTGKEMLARTLHLLSPRADEPFVAVNCGALPDSLLESELFGYKAGAFTGARGNKPGRFALARGGTIFLDEVGEVSPALQLRLLRVLQERTFEPLGSVASEKADVRVLVATNRDLEAGMREGRFREDLYYRINVVRLEIPPLRQRKQDIPLLVQRFVARFNRLQGRDVAGVSPEALSLLQAHDWPGNVRELENYVERAFVHCGTGPIELQHLPSALRSRVAGAGTGTGTEDAVDMRSARAAVDAQSIEEALIRCRGSRTRAARELGIHKSTLFRLIKRLGITPPVMDGRSRPDPVDGPS